MRFILAWALDPTKFLEHTLWCALCALSQNVVQLLAHRALPPAPRVPRCISMTGRGISFRCYFPKLRLALCLISHCFALHSAL